MVVAEGDTLWGVRGSWVGADAEQAVLAAMVVAMAVREEVR